MQLHQQTTRWSDRLRFVTSKPWSLSHFPPLFYLFISFWFWVSNIESIHSSMSSSGIRLNYCIIKSIISSNACKQYSQKILSNYRKQSHFHEMKERVHIQRWWCKRLPQVRQRLRGGGRTRTIFLIGLFFIFFFDIINIRLAWNYDINIVLSLK